VVVYGPKLSTQRKLRYDHRIVRRRRTGTGRVGCPDFRVIRDRTTCHWAAKSKTQSSWRQFSVQLTTALWIWSYFRTTLNCWVWNDDNHNAVETRGTQNLQYGFCLCEIIIPSTLTTCEQGPFDLARVARSQNCIINAIVICQKCGGEV
jgi:hypothetical protein